jgi:hypothetical protein
MVLRTLGIIFRIRIMLSYFIHVIKRYTLNPLV